MKKGILSVLLICCILATIAPTEALAADSTYLYNQVALPEVMPQFPEQGQQYWIIFNEGFRGNRLEMSTFSVSENTSDVRIIWNGNLKAVSADGAVSRCNQFVYTEQEWTQIGTYGILSDKATKVFASNVNVYDGDGKLVVSAGQYDYSLNFTPENGLSLYREVLNQYYYNLSQGTYINTQYEQDRGTLSDIGYCFEDIDRNGIPELIIGSTNQYYQDRVMHLYTYHEGVIYELASSDARWWYNLTEDNRLYYCGSMGYALNTQYICELIHGIIVIKSALFSTYDYNYSSTFYYGTESDYADRFTVDSRYDQDAEFTAASHQISLEQYESYNQSFKPPVKSLSLTLFETYNPEYLDKTLSIRFTDVPDSAYYADAVRWAVQNNITSGTSTTSFSPDATCTRSQIVTFLWRMAGSPTVQGANPFSDVKSGTYYYDAVLWAVKQGITSGTSATTFSPEMTVTRDQAVTFLYRFAGSPSVSGSNSFTDVLGNAYYASAVQWAVNNNVTSGTSASTFSPGSPCTRAQTVTFLFRLSSIG